MQQPQYIAFAQLSQPQKLSQISQTEDQLDMNTLQSIQQASVLDQQLQHHNLYQVPSSAAAPVQSMTPTLPQPIQLAQPQTSTFSNQMMIQEPPRAPDVLGEQTCFESSQVFTEQQRQLSAAQNMNSITSINP